MSLDDQFNKSDGGVIDTIDSFYFNTTKKVAEYWQNKTHKNKSVLESTLYGIGAIGLSLDGVLCHNYFQNLVALMPAKDSYRAAKGSMPRMTGKDMEICSESLGLPKKAIKAIYAMMITSGVCSIATGTIMAGVGLAYGDTELVHKSLINIPWAIGFSAWISAQYMQRSDIGEPPPKPQKKPVLARIKEYLEGVSDSVGEAVDGAVGSLVPSPEPKLMPIKSRFSETTI